MSTTSRAAFWTAVKTHTVAFLAGAVTVCGLTVAALGFPTVRAVAVLARAFAPYAWPTAALIFALLFRKEVVGVLQRLRKFNILGQEVELLGELVSQAEDDLKVAVPVPQLPAPPPPAPPALPGPPPQAPPAARDTGQGPLAAAITSALNDSDVVPRIAVVELAADIERELRRLVYATGWYKKTKTHSVLAMSETASVAFKIPALRQIAAIFLRVRNQVIHGRGATDEELEQAVRAGEATLQIIRSLPRETNKVFVPRVDLYTNAEGTNVLPGAHGVVLETFAATKDRQRRLRVFPTTRQDYRKGQEVSWEWDMSKTYGETWYRNPETGQLELAWSSSTEFAGCDLDTV